MLYNGLTKQTNAHNKRVRVRYELYLSESYENILDQGLQRVLVDDLYKSSSYYFTLSVLNTMLISHKRSSKHVNFIM